MLHNVISKIDGEDGAIQPVQLVQEVWGGEVVQAEKAVISGVYSALWLFSEYKVQSSGRMSAKDLERCAFFWRVASDTLTLGSTSTCLELTR